MKRLTILGSTGSIGVNTLEVVAAFPERFQVDTLTAGGNVALLAEQVRCFQPQRVAVATVAAAEALRRLLPSPAPEVLSGVEGIIACATGEATDMVVSAIVGAAGLMPTMAAIEAGKDVALANKETLVTAGPLVMQAVQQRGVRLFPVDSEHSAIFQSLQGHRTPDVRRLILTASGGPFRALPTDRLQQVTAEQALAHPTWSMGRKISIDSATLMNKGLEVIEASYLFGLPGKQIDVLVHPESIVHSMVEYRDGSVIAQMGWPDMKTPIAYALSWPERLQLAPPPLDLARLGRLQFEAPDMVRFPCLELAYHALATGGTAPAVLNAANEIAVEYFLRGNLTFPQIAVTVEQVLAQHRPEPLEDIRGVLLADRWGREQARRIIEQT